jgi:hypothetical protein
MKKIIVSMLLMSLMCVSRAQMYLEMSLGVTSTALAEASNKVTTLTNDDPSMGSIGLGVGYKLHPNFAVVSKYQTLYEQKSFESSSGLIAPNIKSHALSIRAVGIIPINSFVSVNAKVGLGKTKITVNRAWSSNDLNYGVGVDFSDKKNSIGLDVDFYPTKAVGDFPSLKQTNVSVIAKQYF